MSLRTEIKSLKQTIAMAVAQITTKITSLLATTRTSDTNTMDIETATKLAVAPHPTQLDITSLLSNLKHEIAMIVIETHALFQQHTLTMMNTKNLHSKN